ncbi:CBU_0592 family membrane protein [Agriterribacter sp.]|uniref:CBU_0592 family membrane protein n=1 Tax=Agriterribacter sp. TaxID=2821509 RepID=UPI002C3413E7|nr:hypothetical protein [Agriterribacter sp.]HTN08416.1 hypothetical protein [Agriterribacter sp.]
MTFELIGWLGAISYLIGYFLLVIKKISADCYTYHVLNMLGALGLIFNAWYLQDHPNIMVNVTWLLIAIYALGCVFKLKKKEKGIPENI